MKKYTHKKNVTNGMNFDNEIKSFVNSVPFKIDKEMLTKAIQQFFVVLKNNDIDLWHVKKHIKENMASVLVKIGDENMPKYWLGEYDPLSNEIGIKRPHVKKEVELCSTILHELIHCITSSLIIDLSKTRNQNKINGISYSIGLQIDHNIPTKEGFLHEHLGSTLLTEGLTEALCVQVMREAGYAIKPAYFEEGKLVGQLSSTLGKELVQAFFYNDLTFLDKYYDEPKKENAKMYYTYLNHIFTNRNDPSCESVFLIVNQINMQFFENQLFWDFENNKDKFNSGLQVKDTLVKSFILYAKDFYLGQNASDETFTSLWDSMIVSIDRCYEHVSKIFEEIGFKMPYIKNNEMAEIIEKAQKNCQYRYLAYVLLEKLDINFIKDIDIDKYISKLEKSYNKYEYKYRKYIPNLINTINSLEEDCYDDEIEDNNQENDEQDFYEDQKLMNDCIG